MDIVKYFEEKLGETQDKKKVFLFNGEKIKAFAHENGFKCGCLKDMKDFLKRHGFEYSYTYNCYIKKDKDSTCSDSYRLEKDNFIESIINWRILSNFKSKIHGRQNERNSLQVY